MARLAQVFRHPVKGIGSEPLEVCQLSPEGAMSGDRAWALLTAAAEDIDAWQPRRNFLVVARGPDLSPITARTIGETIELSHPGRPSLTFDPATEADALRNWIAPLWPSADPAPARLVRAPGHGMTDMPEPFVSIGNLASLEALGEAAGQPLDPRRFRINLWVENLPAWEETNWIGQELHVGPLRLFIDQPIGRCRAPDANPETGTRDVIVNRELTTLGKETNFGVYARVLTSGSATLGDKVTLT